jgi:hypothetical protein
MNAYVVVSLVTGARTEELRALSWSRVNLDGNPPTIVREHGDTKTTKSRRTLELPARCVEALTKHRICSRSRVPKADASSIQPWSPSVCPSRLELGEGDPKLPQVGELHHRLAGRHPGRTGPAPSFAPARAMHGRHVHVAAEPGFRLRPTVLQAGPDNAEQRVIRAVRREPGGRSVRAKGDHEPWPLRSREECSVVAGWLPGSSEST